MKMTALDGGKIGWVGRGLGMYLVAVVTWWKKKKVNIPSWEFYAEVAVFGTENGRRWIWG